MMLNFDMIITAGLGEIWQILIEHYNVKLQWHKSHSYPIHYVHLLNIQIFNLILNISTYCNASSCSRQQQNRC